MCFTVILEEGYNLQKSTNTWLDFYWEKFWYNALHNHGLIPYWYIMTRNELFTNQNGPIDKKASMNMCVQLQHHLFLLQTKQPINAQMYIYRLKHQYNKPLNQGLITSQYVLMGIDLCTNQNGPVGSKWWEYEDMCTITAQYTHPENSTTKNAQPKLYRTKIRYNDLQNQGFFNDLCLWWVLTFELTKMEQ